MKILVYLENMERAQFFLTLLNEFEKFSKHQVQFITDKFSISLYLKRKNLNFYEISNCEERLERNDSFDDMIKNSYHYVRGQVTSEQAYSAYASIQNIFEYENIDPDMVFIFNGEGYIDKFIASYFSKVSTVYFEIGNFPGKMFVDGHGVNAKSSLMNRKIDANISYVNFNYEDIQKSKMALPPQAKVKFINLLENWLLDIYGALFKNNIYFSVYSLKSKGKVLLSTIYSKKLISKLHNLDEEKYQLLKDYIFVPLQVSTDTQLLFNSDVDNFDLIDSAIKTNLPIVIKFHPAEKNYKHIGYVFSKYSSLNNVYFTSSISTPTLIENAKEIYSINSNVGLEAILQRKIVKFHGRTIYENFDFQDAATYINDTLVSITYPRVHNLQEDSYKKIMERAKVVC